MQEVDLWSWRAVDVEGEDGLVRRGMIKNMDSHGDFTVDFGYSGHRGDIIPSNKCWQRHRLGNSSRGSSVEVLLQLDLDQPWCWFPSKSFAGPYNSFAFMVVDIGGTTVQDFVPSKRIGYLPVTKRRYECCKYELELPNNQKWLTLTDRKDFFQIWNRCTGTLGIAVHDKKLTYLCEGYWKRVIYTDHLYSTFVLSSDDSEPHTKLSTFGETCTLTDPDPRPLNAEKISEVLGMSLFCINTILPTEIILNMFSFLYVDEQIKCRQVCQKWSDLLKSSRRVEIDLVKYKTEHALALTVHKVITSSTQILVLTGSHPDETDIFAPFRIVVEMLRAKSIKVPVIVISHRTVWADDLLDYSDPCQLKFRAGWADVCGKLMLEEVTLRALFEAQDKQNRFDDAEYDHDNCCWNRYYKDSKGVVFKSVKGVINTNEEVKLDAMLNILEGLCPKLELLPNIVRFVKKHLTEVCQESSPMWRESVFKMLRKWQPGDARFCSNAEWRQDHLAGIALESLQKLTVLALRYHLGERARAHYYYEEAPTWRDQMSDYYDVDNGCDYD